MEKLNLKFVNETVVLVVTKDSEENILFNLPHIETEFSIKSSWVNYIIEDLVVWLFNRQGFDEKCVIYDSNRVSIECDINNCTFCFYRFGGTNSYQLTEYQVRYLIKFLL